MAVVRFTDAEVSQLINERKQLPRRWERRLLMLRPKKELSQRRSGLVIRGESGEFEIKVRQAADYPLDFSVIVAFREKNESSWFILRRYNGRPSSAAYQQTGSRVKTSDSWVPYPHG